MTPAEVSAEAWAAALEWYREASQADIEAEIALLEHHRTKGSWLRLAAIALDQGDVDPRKVRT